MKLPEYALKFGIQISNGNNADPLEFPAGTLIMPFWSEHNLPKHILDQLKEHLKLMPKGKQYVMCLIGRTWVPLERNNIRQN